MSRDISARHTSHIHHISSYASGTLDHEACPRPGRRDPGRRSPCALLAPPAGALGVTESFTVPRPALSRSSGTASGTATECRSTAPKVRPRRASSTSDPEVLLPGDRDGQRRRLDQGAGHRAHRPELAVLAQPGLTVRDRGTMKDYPLPGNLGATQWRLECPGPAAWSTTRPTPGTATGRVAWPAQGRRGLLLRRSGRLTLVLGSGQPRLPQPAGQLSPTPGTGGGPRSTSSTSTTT